MSKLGLRAEQHTRVRGEPRLGQQLRLLRPKPRANGASLLGHVDHGAMIASPLLRLTRTVARVVEFRRPLPLDRIKAVVVHS